MKTENIIRVMAGSLVLVSLLLGHFINPHWLWLAAFVGVNLIQSAITGFCPACKIIGKLGIAKDSCPLPR